MKVAYWKKAREGFYIDIGCARYYVRPLKYILLKSTMPISLLLIVSGNVLGLIILSIAIIIALMEFIKIKRKENSLSKHLHFD